MQPDQRNAAGSWDELPVMAVRFSKWLGSVFLLGSVVMPPQSAFAQRAPADDMVATRYDVARRVTGAISPDPDGTGPLKFAAPRNTHHKIGRAHVCTPVTNENLVCRLHLEK